MGDVQTIDEALSLVRVWDSTGQPHSFTFLKLKEMTIAQLTTELKAQPAWADATDMLCFEADHSKDKADMKPLVPKKKLISLKKKWGANKADHYIRIVWMRAGDNYTPPGMEMVKNKEGRRSYKKHKSGLAVNIPTTTINSGPASPTSVTPAPQISPLGTPPQFSAGVPPPPPPPPMNYVSKSAAAMDAVGSSTPSQKSKGSSKLSKKNKVASKKDLKAGKIGGQAASLSAMDDFDAEKILKEIDAFQDPTGQYDYAEDESRPDFLISNQDLQNRYLNLNTSNANKIARSEHFQRILISWVNKHLAQRKMAIANLHSDLQNGVALINLLEIISHQEIKKYYKEPKHIPHQLENLEIVLKFLGVLGIPIKAECQDIYHGRLGIICGMLFMVIQKFKDGDDAAGKKKIDIKVQKLSKENAAARLAAAASSSNADAALASSSSRDSRQQVPTSKEFGGFHASRPSAAEMKVKYSTTLTPMAPVPLMGSSSLESVSRSAIVPPPMPGLPPPFAGGPPRSALPTLPPSPGQNRNTSSSFPAVPQFINRNASPMGGRPAPPMPTSKIFGGLPPPPAPLTSFPPPMPVVSPPPMTLQEMEQSVEGELSLDALDDLDLGADILDLENFDIPESYKIDVSSNDVMKDLDAIKNFLDTMAEDQELTLDDLNISFDDILL